MRPPNQSNGIYEGTGVSIKEKLGHLKWVERRKKEGIGGYREGDVVRMVSETETGCPTSTRTQHSRSIGESTTVKGIGAPRTLG